MDIGDFIAFIIGGLIIGAIARAIKKGPQDLSLPMTALLGMAGSFVGGLIASLIGLGTIVALIVAIIVAVLLIGFMEKRGHA